MKNVEDMKNINFMVERLTEDAGKAFAPARYNLKSRNDAIISPYKTYELFFEITFMVIQKLGAYEEIGTPEECLEAMQTARACQAQYLDNINDPLEPLKISSALKSELLKLQFRKAEKPESILMYKGQVRMKSGGAIGETNNRMEMQAVLEAMKSITDKTIPVEVYSDSNYVVETMNGHFAMKKNRDLWRKLMRERQKFTSIRFIWVKGHDKNQHNNDVDRQAVAESRKALEAQQG